MTTLPFPPSSFPPSNEPPALRKRQGFPRHRALAASLLLAGGLGIGRLGATDPPAPAQPPKLTNPFVPAPAIRFQASAFGAPVDIAASGVEASVAEAAFVKAAKALGELEKVADPANSASELAKLNQGAGGAPQVAHPDLLRLLDRAQGFCGWSEGAHGALGGELYALWGLRRAGAGAPPPAGEALTKATTAAGCGNAFVDMARGTVTLAAGARIEPRGFLEGLAADRVAETLLASGCPSFLVRVGSVWRAGGKGPAGKGWPVDLPLLPGTSESAGQVVLNDQSVALVAPPRPLKGGAVAPDAGFSGYLNLRTGRPPEGVIAVAALTQFALDAEGLAVALYAMGPREGQLRAGSLSPKPSASWWMGTGEGLPLQVHYRWSLAQNP